MKKSVKADALFGYLIPLAFLLFAGYQQVTVGSIDKYVIAVLFVFALTGLGYRVDTLLETYARLKYGRDDRREPDV